MNLFKVLCFLFILTSCGSDSSSSSSNDDTNKRREEQTQNLSGSFSGTPWSFKSGRAISQGNGEYWLDFSERNQESPCDSGFIDGQKDLSIALPLKLGTVKLGDKTVNFMNFSVTSNGNLEAIGNAAFTGRFEINAITENTVEGFMDAWIDERNQVKGFFEISLCK